MPDRSAKERGDVPRQVWIDGELVPWKDATVHVLSHSHQRGSLVFDYMSVHETPQGAALFRMADHVDRLMRSCELVGLPLEQTPRQIQEAILETCRANPGAKAVKVSAYFASVEVDVVPMDPHVTVAIAAYDPGEDIIKRNEGRWHKSERLKLWIEKEKHNRRDDIVPAQAKVSGNYTSPMTAKWKAREAGYDDILLVDESGDLAEGPTTNLFLVDSEGTLRTPPLENVLHGVTRQTILDLAKHDGIDVREVAVRPEDLLGASEAFLTGTTAGVWPIESVDGQVIGDGQPGPISRALRDHFVRAVSGEDPAFSHWLTLTGEA
jgi:branched-chain amino acid aminotransferase